MPLIIPIQVSIEAAAVAVFENRYALLLSADITSSMDPQTLLLSGDARSGEGTIVFIDVISTVLDSAR